MLKIKPPNYQFCPFCGGKLEIKKEEERERKFCSSCNWTYYPHVACAVAAVIVRGSRVLMVRRNREPYKGTWMSSMKLRYLLARKRSLFLFHVRLKTFPG